MKKYTFVTVLILLYIPQCYAFPTSFIDDLARAISHFFSKASDDAAKTGAHLISNNSDDAAKFISQDLTKLSGKSPEQMFMQYETLKTTKPEEAYWWLHHAALKGSLAARRELDKQCLDASKSSLLKVYCGDRTVAILGNIRDTREKPATGTVEDGVAMYEKYKDTNPSAAYYWLNKSATDGNQRARTELTKLCKLNPAPADVFRYCGKY